MKAAIYTQYGPPDVVEVREVEAPAPNDDEVLVKVRAASINPLDWHYMRGKPNFMRLMTGLRKPKRTGLGVDVAGQVESAGKNVKEFGAGDEVFGNCRGALAEYACAKESALTRKPKNVTFEQAAATPVAALTALQGLRDSGRIQAGQAVLINGASGGVGTFAVQIAKWFGAEVTGVCSSRNLEMVRGLGADRVVDYIREDFTTGGQRFHLILDLVGNHSPRALRRVLEPRGIYVGSGGGGPDTSGLAMLAGMAQMMLYSVFVRERLVTFLTRPNKKDLETIGELVGSGSVRPVVDRCFGLSEAAEAIRYLEGGHARGKVVVGVG
ncbi:MAG TPA: NAD(P)-dependent alcohol dehydrogenase [Candidatus Acidoferrales bacterium]|nr:NAD(P)-dependent alcohol dehydrogenase [Candidatus Acidoferrales bacterium]